jgi:hypothetical protein
MSYTVSASSSGGAGGLYTLGLESTLASDTTNASYTFSLDMSGLTAGDIFESRYYSTILASGSTFQAWKGSFAGSTLVVTNPIKEGPPLASDISLKVTVLQRSGRLSISAISTLASSLLWGASANGVTSGAAALIVQPAGGPVSTSGASMYITMVLNSSGKLVPFSSGEVINNGVGGSSLCTCGVPSTFAPIVAWKLLRA